MAVGDAYVFPGFLTPVLTQLFFPNPLTTFLTCFCRGERRKYAGKKSRLYQGSNSSPPSYQSDTLTTEPPRRGLDQSKNLSFGKEFKKLAWLGIKPATPFISYVYCSLRYHGSANKPTYKHNFLVRLLLSHYVFYSIRKFVSLFVNILTSDPYLLLNWKSPKLACEVKG